MTASVAPGAVYDNAPQPTRWPNAPSREAHAIGDIVYRNEPTDPAVVYGYGTWSMIGGQFLVGFVAGDPDFDPLGKTGGSKTITIDDHADHTHSVSASAGTAGAGANGVITAVGGTTGVESPTLTHTSGGLSPIKTLPPYRVVYIWERTA